MLFTVCLIMDLWRPDARRRCAVGFIAAQLNRYLYARPGMITAPKGSASQAFLGPRRRGVDGRRTDHAPPSRGNRADRVDRLTAIYQLSVDMSHVDIKRSCRDHAVVIHREEAVIPRECLHMPTKNK
ncbi:hypothetical protein [Marinivivus vitaminiproducens]|uniref:hypothetical protein n=1 Tax=Marinivivus vitaminiproducens TaxID=3035935 RepID=UPI0027A70E3F|nr:hypothetical protein P4R82_18885 [Geminicoccaceae bacterium SCSIO 64248]